METNMKEQTRLDSLLIRVPGKLRRIARVLLFVSATVTCSLTAWANPPGQGIAPAGNASPCGGAFLSNIPFPFPDYFSCIDLGSAPGVATPYGGLTFKYDDPNTV